MYMYIYTSNMNTGQIQILTWREYVFKVFLALFEMNFQQGLYKIKSWLEKQDAAKPLRSLNKQKIFVSHLVPTAHRAKNLNMLILSHMEGFNSFNTCIFRVANCILPQSGKPANQVYHKDNICEKQKGTIKDQETNFNK